MKYLRTYESARDETNVLKHKLVLAFKNYLNGLGYLCSPDYVNYTLYSNITDAIIFRKEKNSFLIKLHGIYKYKSEFDLLVKYFIDRNYADLFLTNFSTRKFKKHSIEFYQTSLTFAFIYVKATAIYDFLKIMEEFINSDEYQLFVNIKKYNL